MERLFYIPAMLQVDMNVASLHFSNFVRFNIVFSVKKIQELFIYCVFVCGYIFYINPLDNVDN